jgi:hypothetical protein
VQHSFPDTEIAMSTTGSASAASGALAGAIDDLHRAALILRQESRPAAQRFRTPDDLRRIADQFSERARACQAVQDALLAAGREAAGARAP